MVYVLLGQAPQNLLIFAGAFNGLILPVGFAVLLWVALRRRDLMHGYKLPEVVVRHRRARLAADPVPRLEVAGRPGHAVGLNQITAPRRRRLTPARQPGGSPAAAFLIRARRPHGRLVAAAIAQANLIIVPKDLAFDMLLFAQRNPKPCPILGVLDAGETRARCWPAGHPHRCAALRRLRRRRKVAEPTDITGYWRDDLVTFIVGCSFTFESALREGGIRSPTSTRA